MIVNDPRGTRPPTGSARGRNLTSSIVEDLGVAIVTGVYSKENPFPVEAELCKQFGASRSVLREAVKMLTAKGLLGARPRQGTWVEPESRWNLLDPDVLRWLLERKFSLSRLREFTQIRLAVEPCGAAMAARVATPPDKAAIQAAVARMQAAERGEDDPLDSDIAFHTAVLQASGNRFYTQLQELIRTALGFSIRATNEFKGVRLASVADHGKVAEAILDGDAETAQAGMQVMIEEVLDLIDRATKTASVAAAAAAAKPARAKRRVA